MRVQFDATAPRWAHVFATALNALFARNETRLLALEERVKALEDA